MDTQSRNLTIPRGKGFFAEYLPGTQTPGPMRELGNCPEFSFARNSEDLPHYSSQGGMKTLDENVSVDATLTASVSTDDMKIENARFWWMGDVQTITTTAQTNLKETYTTVKSGDTYQLGRSNSNPSGHRKITNVTVTDGATVSPVTFVAGTDYEVDLDLGLVTFLLDKPKAEIKFDTTASSRSQVAAGYKQAEGELKFISFNPFGEQVDYTFPRARIAPNGDLPVVNDPSSTAYQTLGITITALKKGNLALAYRDNRPA